MVKLASKYGLSQNRWLDYSSPERVWRPKRQHNFLYGEDLVLWHVFESRHRLKTRRNKAKQKKTIFFYFHRSCGLGYCLVHQRAFDSWDLRGERQDLHLCSRGWSEPELTGGLSPLLHHRRSRGRLPVQDTWAKEGGELFNILRPILGHFTFLPNFPIVVEAQGLKPILR